MKEVRDYKNKEHGVSKSLLVQYSQPTLEVAVIYREYLNFLSL